MLYCSTAIAQIAKITGRIIDQLNGKPVQGVSITIKGKSGGAITDANGNFSLNAAPSDIVVFSSAGYITQEQKLGNESNITVQLSYQVGMLNDVVIVGYGQQKKVNLTGSVGVVKGEDLTRRQVDNAFLALQGIVPGLTIRQLDGQPGSSGAYVRIRGEGSINAGSSPLVLVDGVEMDFNQIDMSTVESISVLKDAASASIYGSRAANGVILVTTKRGANTNGRPRMNYSSYVSLQTATNMPESVSTVDYMKYINQANKNNGANPQFSDQLINDYITLGADNFTRYSTDWRGLVMNKNAVMQNHSLTLNAGTDMLRTILNVSYFDQNGLIANNHYTRYTLRSNTDFVLTKWLKTTLDLNFRNSQYTAPSSSDPKSIIRKAMSFVPIFSGINNDGSWGYGQNGDNPIAASRSGGAYHGTSPEVLLNGSIVITPFRGFTSTTAYTTRYSTSRGTSFIQPYDTYEGGVFKASYPPYGSQGSEAWNQTVYKLFRSLLNYNTSLEGKHEINLLGGFQSEQTKLSSFSASRRNYSFPGYTSLNNGDPSTSNTSGSAQELAIASVFSRLNYAFAGKYLLELNGRWDASSRFSANNRWGFFPSASVGWRIFEERFMKGLLVISSLKIRASYGLLGNQNLGSYYPYVSTIDLGYSYWFDKQLSSGGAQTILANPNITWEKSRQFDIGIDADFFKHSLSLSFDYYRRYIYDMLQQLPVPYVVGMGAPFVNAGSMENRGWELAVGYNNRLGGFRYSVNAMLADVQNKVLDLHGRQYIGTTVIKEGFPINSYYGYRSAGYFQNQSDIDKWPVQFGTKAADRANTKPGYIRYMDINNSVFVNDSDRVVLGNAFPRYEYSTDLKLGWKGFDLDIFAQGVGERSYYISGYGAQPFYVGGTIFKSQTDTWSSDNPKAKFPLLLIDGSGVNPNYKISDKWLTNAAYLRLKLVTLGYSLPKKIADRVKVTNIRLYVSAQNLFTFSNFYQGYDVEAQVSGGEFYPIMKTYTVGVNVIF
ncbi:MAG: TonB-dependent receptor [Flavisolibacter sp.]